MSSAGKDAPRGAFLCTKKTQPNCDWAVKRYEQEIFKIPRIKGKQFLEGTRLLVKPTIILYRFRKN